MYILSLDPSLSSTGYSIIDSHTKELIQKGKINTSSKYNTDDRIQLIIKALEVLPSVPRVILEDGFIGVNGKTGMQLAQLRGALIAYYKYHNYIVIHQEPSEIRKNFGLKGNAKKDEVAQEVLKYYPTLIQEIGPYSDKANKQKTSDIYDAISIGLSYILNLKE